MSAPLPAYAVVVDIETSVVKGKTGGWVSMPWDEPADPLEKPPHGLKFGYLFMGSESGVTGRSAPWTPCVADSLPVYLEWLGRLAKHSPTFVGHNLKFDAAHVPELRLYNSWDTMIAEYILTAQVSKFASLASLVKKYVPTREKHDLIGEGLAAGKRPQDWPEAELTAYLENDLIVTGEVFKCQWALCTPAQRALIMVQSAASLVYGEMESNGLTLDVERTIIARDKADTAREVERVQVSRTWAEFIGTEAATDAHKADWLLSPTALSMWFFAAPAEHTVLVPLTEAEKVGKPKSRVNRKVTIKAPALTGRLHKIEPKDVGSDRRTGSDYYTTNEDVLDAIKAKVAGGYHGAMVGAITRCREYQKLSKTYYTPWLTDIETTTDRRLHPTIHAVSTDTGRTSSANPNAQNVPADARKCVVTRFPSGTLMELDFKQLEVCGLAEVSECPDLTRALVRGEDIHFLSGQKVFGWSTPADMDKEKRRIVKTINFGLIYGGSPKTLAVQAGIDVAVARALVEAFYSRFPGVRRWQDETYKKVWESPDRVGIIPSSEGTTAVHYLTAPTGREYAFPLEPAPTWLPASATRAFRPSPTKVKNYPVQGFATGDIVPLAVVMIRAWLREHWGGVKPLLVVHDSLLLDIPNAHGAPKIGDQVRAFVRTELPKAIKNLWGIELSVPLDMDVTLSTTWQAR